MCAFSTLVKIGGTSIACAIEAQYWHIRAKNYLCQLTLKHRYLCIGEDTDRLGDDKRSSLLWDSLSNDGQMKFLLLIILYMN